MTTYYVGPGGDNGNNATTWALRKLTLSGVESGLSLGAGDIVYVGPGVYREMLITTDAGGSTYSTGTVSLVNASAAVVGSGTSWDANVVAGEYLSVSLLDTGVDGVTNGTATFTAAGGNFDSDMIGLTIEIEGKFAYHIGAVGGATSLTLVDTNSKSWPTSGSGLTYYIPSGEGAYEIESVTDDTNLVLMEPWHGPSVSGVSYVAWGAITFIADVIGENTDGIGGIVRVTGSDDDESTTRATGIYVQSDYRVFRGFWGDIMTNPVYRVAAGADYGVFEDCVALSDIGFYVQGDYWTMRRCTAISDGTNYGFYLESTYGVIESCFTRSYTGIRVGGSGSSHATAIKNFRAHGLNTGIQVASYAAGYACAVRNCDVVQCNTGLSDVSDTGSMLEDYNNVFLNLADRTNVGAGSNSVGVLSTLIGPTLREGYRFPVSVFRPSQWHTLVDFSGLYPPYRDMYGVVRPTGKESIGPIQFFEVQRDEDTVYESNKGSMKLSDAMRRQFRVPVTSAETMIKVQVYREADYTGTAPQLVIREPGQEDLTFVDAGSVSTWNELVSDLFTPAVGSDYVTVELVSNNTATSGSYATYFYKLETTTTDVLHQDTFTEAGNPALTAHTPEVGNGYSQGTGTGTFAILSSSNVVDITGCTSYRTAWTLLDEVPRQIKMDWRQPNAFAPMSCLFRLKDTNDYWEIKTIYSSNDMWLYKVVSGTPTEMDSDLNVVHAAETWYTFWIDIDGDNIDVYFALKDASKPGSPILSSTGDSTHASETGVGFWADTNSQRWDNLWAWSTLKE